MCQTHLEVVVCVLLCRSVCPFGAASLSFCLLLFEPSPHFSGLRSYCCPNNPSSRKKKEKRGSGEEEEVVVEEAEEEEVVVEGKGRWGGNVERKINQIN